MKGERVRTDLFPEIPWFVDIGSEPESERSWREGGVRKLGYMPLSILYVKTERN